MESLRKLEALNKGHKKEDNSFEKADILFKKEDAWILAKKEDFW